MTLFFSSDLHFDHKRINELAGRPFSSVEEMNEALIERWNARVTNGDTVYHLGDFSFANTERTVEFVTRLQGNLHFILGNHDDALRRAGNARVLPGRVHSVRDYHEKRVDGRKLVLFHFPIAIWNGAHKGSWHLHGHSHGNFPHNNQPLMDVGVDATSDLTNYAPVAYEEVAEILSTRTFNAVDHHGAD